MTSPNTDPKKFGPELWRVIHVSAINMNQDEFIKWVTIQLNNIPCGNCRQHALEYLRSSPPEVYKDVYDKSGEFIGMFKWTWMFHNEVNKRLGYKIMDYQMAYNLYNRQDVTCSETCGN